MIPTIDKEAFGGYNASVSWLKSLFILSPAAIFAKKQSVF